MKRAVLMGSGAALLALAGFSPAQPKRCAMRHCDVVPKGQLRFNVWALGQLRGAAAPSTAMLEMPLCDEHFQTVRDYPEKLISKDIRRTLDAEARRVHKRKCDWSTLSCDLVAFEKAGGA